MATNNNAAPAPAPASAPAPAATAATAFGSGAPAVLTPPPPPPPPAKLGTVVSMVQFDGGTTRSEQRVLESFYGVPASAWEGFAHLAASPSTQSAERRMGYEAHEAWKKTLRVGDKCDVQISEGGAWHEGIIRKVPYNQSSASGYYNSGGVGAWTVAVAAFDGAVVGRQASRLQIAPRGLYVGNWRSQLKVGDRVEAQREDGGWVMARVTKATGEGAAVQESSTATAPLEREGGPPVDVSAVLVAGDTFQRTASLNTVNKGAEYRLITTDCDRFGTLRGNYAKNHDLREPELALWSRSANRPDIPLALDSCARDYHLPGAITIVVTKERNAARDQSVVKVAADVLELAVIGGDSDEKLSLPRDSNRLTRAGTHCSLATATKLKALDLLGPPRQVLKRMLYDYLASKDPRRCHSGEINNLVAKCHTQEDVHAVLKQLAAEFKDGTFALPPLPDVEQAPLQVIGGVLRHAASGLSTKAPTTSGYYSTPDAPRDAIQAFLAPGRALSKTTNVSASLGHVGLNWTPKRHATTSPALVEVIQTTLLCSVADRAKPYSERSIARLPNRLLVHNVFSYLADINSVRVNKDMELDTSPPNGIYKAGGIQVTGGGYGGYGHRYRQQPKKEEFVLTPLKKQGTSMIGFLADSIVLKVPVSLEIELKPNWLSLIKPSLSVPATGGYGGYGFSYRQREAARVKEASRAEVSTLIATLAHASPTADGASVHEVAQPSILAATPWARPAAPPARLGQAAPHLAILEAARPSSQAPMAPSPKKMSSTTLRPYQRRALAWMIAKEDGSFNAAVDNGSNLDPAFREYKSSDGQTFFEPRRRVEFTAEKPTGGQWRHEPGGILADEMGLGKTVVVAALLISRPRPASDLLPAGRWPQCLVSKKTEQLRYRAGQIAARLFELAGEQSTITGTEDVKRSTRSRGASHVAGRYSDRLAVTEIRAELDSLDNDPETVKKSKFFKCVDNKPIDDGLIKRVPIKATLVVMPSLLIQQWTTELARHAPCLKVLVYEGAEASGGSGKGVCAKDLADQDVVLMNFETLQRELAEKKFASPLLHVQWWRMMTDEAQMCKTGGPEMAIELAKINRWAVTGTPLSSSFDDLVPQLYFLELEPFMTVKPKDGIWEGLLDDAINHHRPPAIMALTNLVRLVMWRNLKKHVEDEVTLPALTVSNETVTSSPAESVLYAHRYHEMRGVLEKELRARKARGEFAARDDVDDAAKARAGKGLRLPKAKGTGNASSPEAWTLALRAMTDHAALFGATTTSSCPKTLDTHEAALEALPLALDAVEQTRLDVAQAFLSVAYEAMTPDKPDDDTDVEDAEPGDPDTESAERALRKALPHLDAADSNNNVALWYKWLAGKQLSSLVEQNQGPIYATAKAELAKLVNKACSSPRVVRWLTETKAERAEENARRRATGIGVLNSDPTRDIESYIKSIDSILPQKRYIKACRATLVHTARIAEREAQALQAEKHLITVERNAARYGESLAASGLTGDRESVGVPSPDEGEAEPEEPPKKKSKSKKPAAKKPAARKKRGRAAAAEVVEEPPVETLRPERFCEKVEPLPASETSTKLTKLVEVVKSRASKVVVFSQFEAALELAQRALKTAGLACCAPALLPVEDRPEAVSAFVNETGLSCMLLTLDHSQSAGLTLTVASTVVLLDPVLDTAIEDQAIARVHRIGQSVPVQAIRLCQGDTVDETIVALQEARRGAKRQKGALSATGQLRVAELVKLFAVEEEA